MDESAIHHLFKMPRPHWHPVWKIESSPTTVPLAGAAVAVPLADAATLLPVSHPTVFWGVQGMHRSYQGARVFSFPHSGFSALKDITWFHENHSDSSSMSQLKKLSHLFQYFISTKKPRTSQFSSYFQLFFLNLLVKSAPHKEKSMLCGIKRYIEMLLPHIINYQMETKTASLGHFCRRAYP